MKTFFTFLIFIVPLLSFGTVKTTISDGSWHDPSNWNPAGVPLNEDTVIVAHDISVTGSHADFGANWLIVNSNASIVSDTIFSLHGNLRNNGLIDVQHLANGDGDSTLVYGTVNGVYFSAGNPVNINYGDITSDTLSAGENFDNYGLIDVIMLTAGGPSFTNHTGAAIVVSGLCTFSSLMENQAGATMDLADLVTNGNSTNDGDIACSNWTHGSGTAGGSNGKYCIAMCFINNATISGTIDVCDATPGGFCDIQMGTIAGTVTTCATSSCVSNVGLDDYESQRVIVYPNPVNDIAYLKNGTIGSSWSIVDVSGKMILSGEVEQEEQILRLEELEKGVYFLTIYGENYRETTQLVKQ